MTKSMLIPLALFLSACATPYQEMGFRGGYTEVQLDENVFRVSFRGNGGTGATRAVDFTLLRSAELAIRHGYRYFIIIDSSQHTSKSTHTRPVSATTTISGNTATTEVRGGQTSHIYKPRATNTIVCFENKPEGTFSYNAEFLYRELARRYNLDMDTDVEAR